MAQQEENRDPNVEDEETPPLGVRRCLGTATVPLCKQEPNGSRVQCLVQAFESMMSLSAAATRNKSQGEEEAVLQAQSLVSTKIGEWNAALLGRRQAGANSSSSSSPSSSAGDNSCQSLPLASLELRAEGYHSDSTHDSTTSYASEAGGAARRHAAKRARVTAMQPFSLRTEARGAKREYEFQKKLQKMLEEDKRMKIPIAQGLPWTTDVPEMVPKPPLKESTVPLDVRLCTEYRSVERAEFDQYVAAKIMYIEQQRQEERRLQEIAEEEEVKRLRKQMVPRAQLMPYFDHPFKPRRSSKRLTVPKEPQFHSLHSSAPCRSK